MVPMLSNNTSFRQSL